jgi:hypothetical protein
MPRTIEDVLECATSTPADGLTAPACGTYLTLPIERSALLIDWGLF